VRALGQLGQRDRGQRPAGFRRCRLDQLDVHRHQRRRELGGEPIEVDALRLAQVAVGPVAQPAPPPFLRRSKAPCDLDRAGGRRVDGRGERQEPALDEEDAAVVELQRRDDEISGHAALGAINDGDRLVGQVGTGRPHLTPLDRRRVDAHTEYIVEQCRR